jgi:hypothetical protein
MMPYAIRPGGSERGGRVMRLDHVALGRLVAAIFTAGLEIEAATWEALAATASRATARRETA